MAELRWIMERLCTKKVGITWGLSVSPKSWLILLLLLGTPILWLVTMVTSGSLTRMSETELFTWRNVAVVQWNKKKKQKKTDASVRFRAYKLWKLSGKSFSKRQTFCEVTYKRPAARLRGLYVRYVSPDAHTDTFDTETSVQSQCLSAPASDFFLCFFEVL